MVMLLIFLGLPTFPLLSDPYFCDRSTYGLIFFSFSKAAASAYSFS